MFYASTNNVARTVHVTAGSPADDAELYPSNTQISYEPISVDTPAFHTIGFMGGVDVQVKSATEGSKIYYSTVSPDMTIDGDWVINNSRVSFDEEFTGTLYARAYFGGVWSNVSSTEVSITKLNTPKLTLSGTDVTISIDMEGAEIYYTKDGSEPSITNGEKVEGMKKVVALPRGGVVRAIAVCKGYAGSDEARMEVRPSVTVLFNDVKSSDWFCNAVQYAYDNGIMAGMGDDFWPSANITREQFVQILYNHSGKPAVTSSIPFPDVDGGQWYTNAVIWAKQEGIASGMGDGNFGVGNKITREELAQMLYKYAQKCNYDLTAVDGGSKNYADGTKVSKWAQNAMDWAVTQKVLSGKGSGSDTSSFKLDPQGSATRAECASMVKKMLNANGM